MTAKFGWTQETAVEWTAFGPTAHAISAVMFSSYCKPRWHVYNDYFAPKLSDGKQYF